MKIFNVIRDEDPTGVSGTGIVAEGVVFHDGQTAISWFGKFHILEVSENLQTWLDVHDHGGRTRIEFVKRNNLCQTNRSQNSSNFSIKSSPIRKLWRKIFESSAKK